MRAERVRPPALSGKLRLFDVKYTIYHETLIRILVALSNVHPNFDENLF